LVCVHAVSEKLGIEVYFYYNEKGSDVFEDDGFLHIYKNMVRAVFTIGQDLPAKEANERTRAILTALGMEKKITQRVLVDEIDETDCCDTCGRCGFCSGCANSKYHDCKK
jgi:hypothetical protein